MTRRRKPFEQVAKDVFVFRDTCNVYVLRDGVDAILIDFGSGEVLEHLAHIGVRRVEWVLHTHHHREQCQGDHLLEPKGIKLAVPAGEMPFFSGVEEYWKSPERFSVLGAPYCRPLRERVPVDLTLRDGENFRWQRNRRGFDLQCFAGPGRSPGAMYYLCSIGRRTLAFCGDSALAGAKLHTYYDSEWDYGYAEGLITLLRTLARLHAEHPDVLCPSHGDVSREAERDLRLLRRRLKTFIYDLLLRHWDKDTNPYDACTVSRRTPIAGVRRVSEHLFKLDRRNCYIILADSGHALFMDCGLGAAEPATRWLDGKLDQMRQHYGLGAVDAVTISHYHSDHITTIPHLVAHYGAEVWCFENMVEIIEHPRRFNLTCLTGPAQGVGGIPVDRVLRDGETLEWEGFRIKVFHLPGQTWHAMGAAARIDGRMVAFTGDNMFCSPHQSGHDAFIARNRGILEQGYIKCAETLLEIDPDLILGQHAQEIAEPRRQLRQLAEWARAFRRALKRLSFFPEYEYFIDPYWVNLHPYRTRCRPGDELALTLTVVNHARCTRAARLEVMGPAGWEIAPKFLEVELPPRAQVERQVVVRVPKTAAPRRYVFTTDVTMDGERFGELFDALVDVA